ncbi:hypothetical protein P691DRAFT_776410 [Macrolepiota fuliginosa MF-IS2]|uniref:F-box domain-containing protein n=1 Tax=Macrolepiota fuliginosa MF-IS2 TaxID=1400762 RepID=A0A9P6C0X5_9AGAR|nr:hypothetical protein P691DRAFT_776410 [Macrolepiota fuliginosa MF-IS2]
MSVADDIPLEIWDLIASFLPLTERPRLMSLNRYFLAKFLHERYGEIRWAILDQNMIWYLRRLQDPFIARYVQKLHVQAWFINQLVQSKVLRQELRDSFGGSIFRYLRDPTERVKPMSYIPQFAKGNDPSQYTPTQILWLMGNALSHMSNLRCYSFEWRDLPLNAASRRFLETVERSTRGLHKLVLHAQIANYRHLLNYVCFDDLEEISFHFDYDTQAAEKTEASQDFIQANNDTLKTKIAPFINHFSPSLRHLSISSDSKTLMTPLFESLVTFPNLWGIDLNMPFTTSFSEPQLVVDFLAAHSSTLRHVKLNPPFQRYASHQSALQVQSTETRTTSWSTISTLLLKCSPNILANLEALDIPSTGLIGSTVTLLNRSIETLTRLNLSGRYFTPDELRPIYDLFSLRPLYARLVHLRIDVTRINFSVLFDIANRFPRMESLILVSENVPKVTDCEFSTSLDPFTYTYHGRPGPPNVEGAGTITPPMHQVFQEWSLVDIGIYTERYQEHQRINFVNATQEYQAMVKVRRLVPSIKYFKGEEVGRAWDRGRYYTQSTGTRGRAPPSSSIVKKLIGMFEPIY